MRSQREIARSCGWELEEGPDRARAAAEIDAAVGEAILLALKLQTDTPAGDALVQSLRGVREVLDRWDALGARSEETGCWCVEALAEGYGSGLGLESWAVLDVHYTDLLRALVE
jgi:hypothetical protein